MRNTLRMKLITTEMLNDLSRRAAAGPRQRMHHNIHESLDDPIQRLFVAVRFESYFRPHRHREKWECALVVRGLFDVLVFDDAGCVTERVTIGPEAKVTAFEIPAGLWHSWVPMRDDSVFFEIKQGPFHPLGAGDFADWSPEEGSADSARFLAGMRKAKIGECVTAQPL